MRRKSEIPLFPNVFRFFPSVIFFSSPHCFDHSFILHPLKCRLNINAIIGMRSNRLKSALSK